MLLAERMSIPCVKPGPAKRLMAAIAERLESHRWEITFLGAELMRQKLPALSAADEKTPSARELTIALIADEKFLPHLNGLVHNLKEVAQAALRFEILALDDATADFVAGIDAHVRCYKFSELWDGNEPPGFDSWSMADRAFRSKPKFLLRLVRGNQAPVFYFDTDLHFMGCPSYLLDEFADPESSLLLFPNWNDTPEETKRWGVFNAGMIGVRPGCERFLEVWTSLCQTTYQSGADGYVNDQGFLDLIPLYLDRFTVYRRGDENVARWNQLTREDGLTVRSFHASQPDIYGFYEQKMAWDQALWAFADPSRHFRLTDRWAKVLSRSWREHVLPLSRFMGFARVLRRAWAARWLESPRAMRFFVYGAGQALLRLGAVARRFVLSEHKIELSGAQTPWVSQQQLAIRESTSRRKSALPSVVPFEISELAVRESKPVIGPRVEIH